VAERALAARLVSQNSLTAVEFAPQAILDLERIFDFLDDQDSKAAKRALEIIRDALLILQRHPEIGRPAEAGIRELVISRGRTGYIALYDFIEPLNQALILAIRHQSETGYTSA
jgi:plasmid stabilization system protein ParE